MSTILIYIAALVIAIPALFTVILQLPDVVLTAGIGSALVTAGGYMAVVNAFFPIGVLITVFISVHLALESGIFVYKAIMWVVRKFPGVS